MGFLERIRRLWSGGPGPDHPLDEQEREPVPDSAIAEVASLAEGAVGVPFDPDDPRP
jgi:hypothetical protein